MKKAFAILLLAAFMVALPFLFKPKQNSAAWSPDDPVLVVITPHNEAIKTEFATGFAKWHQMHFGRPARIDWRAIGGTTEIMRFLTSEYIGSMQGFYERKGLPFPAAAASAMLSPTPPSDSSLLPIWNDFRTNDSPSIASSRIDVFFGGGTYDHGRAEEQGLTIAPWPSPSNVPPNILFASNGMELIPTSLSGEVFRSSHFYGTVLSTFGICWNPDRLNDLSIPSPPHSWRDIASPAYFGQIGATDPTKSGSVAKAFEMMIHQAMAETISSAGFSPSDIASFASSGFHSSAPLSLLNSSPASSNYLATISSAWENGLNLVRLIGANAKYFTDSAGKVPIDVGSGALAAGIAIDFFGRFQAEYTKTPDGISHMDYATPKGGSCVSADPVSILRGAPHHNLALRFLTFVLSEDGQRLWNSRPGTPNGTEKFALRRLPIRIDFYPSTNTTIHATASKNLPNMSDNLFDPNINPYRLAEDFVYHPEWTSRHFGIQRDLIRAFCLDSGDELRAAWRAIINAGGPEANPEAMALLTRLPTRPIPVTWHSAVNEYRKIPRLDYMRIWTAEIRENYRAAFLAASRNSP